MEISEIVKCKEDLNKKISDLLVGFENETGLQVSSLAFVRRSLDYNLAGEIGFTYAVETKIEL